MPKIEVDGIELDYELFGDPAGTPLLMIHGLGAQRTDWPADFIEALLARGYFLVTFDNRDVGASTWLDHHGEPDLEGLILGTSADAPYLVPDMAADAAGLLAALGIDAAHVLGVSMGGMIAQQVVIDFPDRSLSLTSIMSTPSPAASPPAPEAIGALLVPAVSSREEAIEQSLAGSRVIASPAYPFDEEGARGRAEVHFDRGHHPEGTARQLAAILASPDRAPGLAGVEVPVLVIHGDADILVTPGGGEATAAAVPHAEHVVVPGMGHDLPSALIDELCDRIAAHHAVSA